MKQFLTVLVAALFAAASVTAVAQQKAEKAEKTEKSMSKDAPKKEQTAAQKRQQERRKACNDQASERKLQGDERKKFVSSCLKPKKAEKTQTKAVGKKDEKTK